MSDDDLKTKLAAIREQRAALRETLQERIAPTEAEQLEAEELGLKAEQELDVAQQKHGAKQVRLVQTPAGYVVLRRPHWVAFRKFQDQRELSYESTEELVKGCLLYPNKAQFDRMMEQAPGAMTKLASVCVELAGFRVDELKSK